MQLVPLRLGQAITTRPMTPNGLTSHHEAVKQCVERAVKWVTSYQAPGTTEELVPGTPGVPFGHVLVVMVGLYELQV
jgi:hypothetical protein